MRNYLLLILSMLLSQTATARHLLAIDVNQYRLLAVLYNQAQSRALVEVMDSSSTKAAYAACGISSGLMHDCVVQSNGWFPLNRAAVDEIRVKFEQGLHTGYAAAQKTIAARAEQLEAWERAERAKLGALMATGPTAYGYGVAESVVSAERPQVSNLDARAVQETKQLFRTELKGQIFQTFTSEEGVMNFELIIATLFYASAQP